MIEFRPVPTPPQAGDQEASPSPPRTYTAFWPGLILLLTLIVTTTREIIALHQHMDDIQQENAPALEALKKAGEQAAFVDGLHNDLQKLAVTDPVAAQIFKDFFLPQKQDKPAPDSAKAPGK
jgi:hypothetical protein